MKFTIQPRSFLSLPALGFFAVGLSLLSMSCRVQNKQTTTLKGYDTISGYYGTALQKIEVSAKLKGESKARRKVVGVSLAVPKFLSVLSDPILLYFDDPQKGSGTLRNNTDTSLGLPINVDMEKKQLSYSRTISGDIDRCQMIGTELDTGSFTEAAGTKNGFTVKGAMNLEMTIGYQFTGESAGGCDDPMKDFFEACYLDATKCTEDDYTLVREVFDRSVLSGLIDTSEIRSIEWVNVSMTYSD
jgi:hypothetical protein